MNVFEPLRTYSSPSRRAVACMEPKASDPDPGSVMAQAPILARLRRSGTQRRFWATVPRAEMAAGVRPTETPRAVTIPGQRRHSSMVGIRVRAGSVLRSSASSSPASTAGGPAPAASSAASRLSKLLRATTSMPKVANILRSAS